MFHRNSTSRILLQTHLSNRNKLSGRKGDEGAFIILSLGIKNFRDSITPLEKEEKVVIPPHKMALFQHSNNNSKNVLLFLFHYSTRTPLLIMMRFFSMITEPNNPPTDSLVLYQRNAPLTIAEADSLMHGNFKRNFQFTLLY